MSTKWKLRFAGISLITAVILMMGFLPDQASGQAERSRRVLPSQDPASPAAGQNSTPSQGATAGQSPAKKSEPLPSQDQAEAIRINSTLIAVPVSVTDTSGEPVRNLKPDDFLLDEEGKAQQVVSLGEPGKTPVEIALLFDVSGSVNKRFEFEQQAASRFLRQVVKPNDAASIFAIGFTPRLIQAREMDVDRVITSVLAMAPTKEATAFFDSVVIAARYLGRASEAGTRRVMIVISDGEDNHSESLRLTDALREVQQADCLLYSINPSGPSIRLNKISMKGQEGLVALASATGGAPFLPDKLEDLDAVFRQIAAELQAQYLLGYYSTDERTDGGYRQIAVRVSKKPELRVRARKGYYAPKA